VTIPVVGAQPVPASEKRQRTKSRAVGAQPVPRMVGAKLPPEHEGRFPRILCSSKTWTPAPRTTLPTLCGMAA
jgi:hypothetical protein